MADVLIVGCGLIGASIGMALREVGQDVVVRDESPAVVGTAVRRGAGRPWESGERADLVVVAVPPRVTASVLFQIQGLDLGQTYTHVASVQSQVQAEVQSLNCDTSSIVGGHPLAGRELSGPEGATSDLFAGRPWAVCPSSASSDVAVARVRQLVRDCGADPVELSAAAHDRSVALLSHLPQVLSSALAAGLLAAPEVTGDIEQVRLAGPGLVDTTRLAASDPELWCQILELNAAEIAPVVADLARRLTEVGEALAVLGGPAEPRPAATAAAALRDLLRSGNAGRALVPVKRGVRSDAFAPLRISVRDEPGRLAALLTHAGEAGFNVEDVHVEHLPGRPTGVIEVLVRIVDVEALAAALAARGWAVLERS